MRYPNLDLVVKSAARMHEHKDLPLTLAKLEIKATGDGAFTFEGYGSVWGRVDSYGDTIEKGAFAEAIKTRRPIMLFGHDMNKVPGKYLDASEDSHGLLLKGELTPGHSVAKDLEASLRHQSISGMSIGGYTKAADWIEEDGKIIGRRIKEFDLYEVSLVALPAETEARVLSETMKSALAECQTIRQVEAYMREQLGYSRSGAELLVARVRDLLQGEPAPLGATDGSAFAEAVKGLQLPTSLFGANNP